MGPRLMCDGPKAASQQAILFHVIGDIESLLEASGVDGDDESGGFEETVRQLVVAALGGPMSKKLQG